MKRVLFVLAAVLLSACGPQFAGSFSGPATEVLTCGSDSRDSQTIDGTANLTIKQEGGLVTAYDVDSCPLHGPISSDTVSIGPVLCPPTTWTDGTVSTPHVQSGTLTLKGDSIAFSSKGTIELKHPDNSTVTCTDEVVGTLKRQK